MRIAEIGLIAFAAISASGQSCPWMNAETASGILASPAQIKIARPNECEFLSATSSLRIEIGALHKCGSKAIPLKGIGNEAVACSEAKRGELLEFIAGRVRDRSFVIEIVTKDRSETPQFLLKKARLAAEQVSGNLF